MATRTKIPTVTPTEAYVAADRSGRAQMRADWDRRLNEAIRTSDLNAAQSVMTERDEAMDAAKSGTRSEPVNPAVLVAEQIAVLLNAAALLRDGSVTPQGIDSADVDLSEVETHLTEFAGDEATSNERFAERATAVASKRVSRSGHRGDVGAFIHARLVALTTPERDTFRVSELRAEAIDGYQPTGGAVSAALNAERDIEGVVTVPADEAPSGALSARLA